VATPALKFDFDRSIWELEVMCTLLRQAFSTTVFMSVTFFALCAMAQTEPSGADDGLESSNSESSVASPEAAGASAQQAEEQGTGPLWTTGRVLVGGGSGLLLGLGGGLAGGVIASVVKPPHDDADGANYTGYGILAGAALAYPGGYYLGAGGLRGKGRLSHTYLGAAGAYALVGGLSLLDEDMIFLTVPLTVVATTVSYEISHAYNDEPASAANSADGSLVPALAAWPDSDGGLSVGLTLGGDF
jgi:hypothetical protein